jgi:hypothetical protein
MSKQFLVFLGIGLAVVVVVILSPWWEPAART